MSIIFPGNYVAHLNAYREQGVVALPGVEFYRAVGAIVLNPDNDGVTTTAGVLVAGNYVPQVLSPDLRQDDKPRKDKPLVVPANSVIYRTAVSAPGVKAAASGDKVSIKTTANVPQLGTDLTAGSNLFFPESGASSALVSILNGNSVSVDTTITLTTDADFTTELNPSAGAARNSPSAIICEVCYFRAAAGPDAEDAYVPFAIEAGQGY